MKKPNPSKPHFRKNVKEFDINLALLLEFATILEKGPDPRFQP